MNYIKNLFNKYQTFILGKIPHNIRKSQIFFFGLLTLALPITIALALTQQDIRQRASEIVTPPIPPNPTISGYAFNDADKDGIKGDAEAGYANATIIIYKIDTCEAAAQDTTPTPCPTPEPNTLTTDALGKFAFQAAESGTYSVKYGEGVDPQLIPTTLQYQTISVPPDQIVYFGFSDKPITPTPTSTPSPTPSPTPTLVTPSTTPISTPTITPNISITQIPSITPSISVSISPAPSPICTKQTLSKIKYEGTCRKFAFFPPFFTKGNNSASFTCSDGYKGKVGNSRACYTTASLKSMAESACASRCIQPPNPRILKGDLNIDGLEDKNDFDILIACFSKKQKCEARINPDINGDGKLSEEDISNLQRLMFASKRRQ